MDLHHLFNFITLIDADLVNPIPWVLDCPGRFVHRNMNEGKTWEEFLMKLSCSDGQVDMTEKIIERPCGQKVLPIAFPTRVLDRTGPAIAESIVRRYRAFRP